MRKRKKIVKSNFTLKRLIIFLSIVCFLALTFIFNAKIEKVLGINNPFYKQIVKQDYIVHFVDVGQGDCTIFEFPNDKIMIIDSGAATSESKLKKYLDKVIFKDRKDAVIDYLVATHSDSDHIGNMEYLIDTYEIKTIYRPDIYSSNEVLPPGKVVDDGVSYDKFISAASKEAGCSVKTIADGVLEVCKNESNQEIFSFYFFGPLEDDYSDFNSFSPFILVECNNTKVLLTGDADVGIEQNIINAYPIFPDNIDIYKCGHHGSKYSTSDELLNQFNPDNAVISCSDNNSYGHPSAEVLSKLRAHDVSTYITATQGNIIFGYNHNAEEYVAYGSFTAADSLQWWMIVLVITAISFTIIFSIKIKMSKKL